MRTVTENSEYADGHYHCDKDHISSTKGRQAILRQHAKSMITNDPADPGRQRWTPISFAIESQGVVPCYHHMASIS